MSDEHNKKVVESMKGEPQKGGGSGAKNTTETQGKKGHGQQKLQQKK